MKKNVYYQIRFDEKIYRELCDEYNRRKRIYRRREIISKILWGISAPIIVLSLPFVLSLIFLNYTNTEEWIAFGIILFGYVCGLAAYRIDPNYKPLPSLEEALYEDEEEEE